jgi:hypothetical protein
MAIENQERYTQWGKLVEDQEKSGLSQKEFCSQQSLVLSKFVYYRSRLKNKEKTSAINKISFTPVKILPKENPVVPGEIKLSLPNGFQCSFPSYLDSIQIKRLVEVLLAC